MAKFTATILLVSVEINIHRVSMEGRLLFVRSLEMVFAFVEKQLMPKMGDGNSCFG